MSEEKLSNIPLICPVCQNSLERHPIAEYWSCFVHGDYVFVDGSWIWKPLKSIK